jgi:molybdopterin synthase catalytic subunit
MKVAVTIQTDDFDLGAEVAKLRAHDGGVGAVACFVGTVRDREPAPASSSPGARITDSKPDVTLLELEHYPGMTERAIESMVDAARERFTSIRGVRIVHRVGAMKPLDQIVLVVVTAAHRGEAFAACEFLMDYLKTQAPFWKKEHRPDGSAAWVDARSSDDAALARWGIEARNAAS